MLVAAEHKRRLLRKRRRLEGFAGLRVPTMITTGNPALGQITTGLPSTRRGRVQQVVSQPVKRVEPSIRVVWRCIWIWPQALRCISKGSNIDITWPYLAWHFGISRMLFSSRYLIAGVTMCQNYSLTDGPIDATGWRRSSGVSHQLTDKAACWRALQGI